MTAFTKHPASVGESYLQHLFQAASFASKMIFAGFACLIHALLPFLFVDTASNAIKGLHAHMNARCAERNQ